MLHTAGVRSEKSVFVSTTHCAAGCIIGDIIGAPIVFWAGWTLFGERLYAEYLLLFVLAYIFGVGFQYLPIRAMPRISRRVALLEAIKADTLALTAFEIGLFAWMAVAKFFLEQIFHRIFHSGHEVTTDTGGLAGGAGGREFSGRE
jgi:hypothetical protein